MIYEDYFKMLICNFLSGERVLCFHGPLLYEAKVRVAAHCCRRVSLLPRKVKNRIHLLAMPYIDGLKARS